MLAFSVIGLVVEAAAVVPEEKIANQQLEFQLLLKELMKILAQTPDKAGSGHLEHVFVLLL